MPLKKFRNTFDYHMINLETEQATTLEMVTTKKSFFDTELNNVQIRQHVLIIIKL